MTRRLLPLPRPVGPWPAHPAHLDPYIDTLGQHDACEFFREFGGLTLHLKHRLNGRSRAEQLLGLDRYAALVTALGGDKVTVPLPRGWMVHTLKHTYGYGVPDIVREMRVVENTVFRILATPPTRRALPAQHAPQPDEADDSGQLSLF